jgi:hypothetical protein
MKKLFHFNRHLNTLGLDTFSRRLENTRPDGLPRTKSLCGQFECKSSSVSRTSATTIFIAMMALFIFSSCGSGEKTEEDLAREVFQTFLDDNERGFKQLYINQGEAENIIMNSSLPDDMKNDARKQLRAKVAFFRLSSKFGFRHIRLRAFSRDGVNWQDSEILSIKSDDSNYGFFHYDIDFNKKYNIQVKDITITFLSQRDTFLMVLDDCVKTNSRGWCLGEEVRIHKKY